ncbi:hypothetical protein SAMN05444166_6015 [Singulisphaera sp. GP187]|nr:hypothetical protein SAMN05444166_6015 [Singulisphaera sp. GP187]
MMTHRGWPAIADPTNADFRDVKTAMGPREKRREQGMVGCAYPAGEIVFRTGYSLLIHRSFMMKSVEY